MGCKVIEPSKLVTVLACALLWHRVSPSAIGDQRHNQYQKDAANSINGQSVGQEVHQGEKINENQNALSENKNNHFVGAKDNGIYANQDVNKKIYDDNKFYSGQNFNQDSGERVNGVAQKKGHKKGHHNSGFRNSYHKDESSNNSSYFDDYNDEADQSNIHNDRGRYGNEAAKRYDNRKEDGIRHLQDNTRQGSYDRRGGSDVRNVDHRDYDRKHYQDDRRDLSKLNRGQNYAGRDREFSRNEASPHFHGRPPYYDRPAAYPPRPFPEYHGDHFDDRLSPRLPPPPPPPPTDLRRIDPIDHRRQTITIYEDPRIMEPYNAGEAVQSDEFVRLEVRPGNQRFQRFDNFYEPRRNWGVNRRSDINPLVFNYNRY